MAQNDVLEVVLRTIRERTEEANKHAEAVASQNVGKMVHDLREESDDEKVVSFRKFVEDLDTKREHAVTTIDEYIRTKLIKTDETVDVEKEKDAYRAAKDGVTGGLAVLKSLGLTVPDDLPELKSLRGGNAGTGGSSGPKPRVSLITVDGNEIVKETTKDGVTKRVSNFTLAAQKLSTKDNKVEPKDLQAATFESAGTNDLKSLAPETEIAFSFNVGDKSHDVVVYTQAAK